MLLVHHARLYSNCLDAMAGCSKADFCSSCRTYWHAKSLEE
jgi:hypothetical protein